MIFSDNPETEGDPRADSLFFALRLASPGSPLLSGLPGSLRASEVTKKLVSREQLAANGQTKSVWEVRATRPEGHKAGKLERTFRCVSARRIFFQNEVRG